MNIYESGLVFGEYEESDIFHVEQSSIYKSLGEGVCTAEFVLYREPDKILMIEAKSSAPRPSKEKNAENPDFDRFIDEVYSKFVHSLDLYFSLVLKRLEDRKGEMPDKFKTIDYDSKKTKLKLVLVINGHETAWLSPITAALKEKMSRQVKTFSLDIIVLNHELAFEYRLLAPPSG
jgi:hypothetical protein